MGKQYKKLTKNDIEFIENQKLFFIASASTEEVNLSPKGYDCLCVLNDTQVLYVDYPGSGNRTGRDIANDGEITIMFNAFEGTAQIVRLFCKGIVISKQELLFDSYLEKFTVDRDLIRQMFLFDIYAVESSCGLTVPTMIFKQERKGLKNWAKTLAKQGKLESYIEDHEIPVNLKRLS